MDRYMNEQKNNIIKNTKNRKEKKKNKRYNVNENIIL